VNLLLAAKQEKLLAVVHMGEQDNLRMVDMVMVMEPEGTVQALDSGRTSKVVEVGKQVVEGI
jgi:hypothetical protein